MGLALSMIRVLCTVLTISGAQNGPSGGLSALGDFGYPLKINTYTITKFCIEALDRLWKHLLGQVDFTKNKYLLERVAF
jgi:hypothetical protein